MVKIAQGPRNAVAPEGLENLSEDERKAFMRQTARHGGGRIVSDQATVPQKVHQDKVRELEGEISSLRSKVEELKTERNQIREERDSYRDRFERKLEELKASESAMEQLRSERSELGDRVRALQAKVDSAPKEPKVVRDDTEVKRLQKEKREIESEMESVRTELDDALASLESERHRVAELEAELEMARDAARASSPLFSVGEVSGKVTRTSPSTMESDLFSSPRYLVRMSRDGRRMRFSPDIEGRAICRDGAIDMPLLAELVPFSEPTAHDAVVTSDGTVVIVLQ